MSVTRIDPPILLMTPKGEGWAHFLIDYSQEHHVIWGVFINETGECWWVPNPEVRITRNWSMQRRKNDKNDDNSFGVGG